MAVRVTVDLRELRALRRTLEDLPRTVRPYSGWRVGREIAREALRQHQDRYSRREAPDGNAWPPRKPPTGDHPLLEKTGRLRGSIRSTVMARGQQVAVRSLGVAYAGIHQFGSERIPQRQFLGFGDGDVDELAGTAEHWLGRFVGEVLR